MVIFMSVGFTYKMQKYSSLRINATAFDARAHLVFGGIHCGGV